MDFYNQSHFLYSHISPSGNASLIDLALVSNLPQLHKCSIVPPLANSDHSGLEMSIKCREDTRATNCEAGTRERPANLFILAHSRRCCHPFTYVSFPRQLLHTNPFSHFST